MEDSLGNFNMNWALDDVKVFVLLEVIMVLWLCKKMLLFLEILKPLRSEMSCWL